MDESSVGAVRDSRRRREIAKIIDDMNMQLTSCAEAHHGHAVRRQVIRTWQYNIIERARLIAIAKQGGVALFHRSMRKGMNGWIAMITRIAGALAQLRASAVIFRNRGLKKALNTMNQQRLARQAAFGSMKRAAMSFINAALVRGYRKLQAGGRMRGKLKLASRQILYRNRRKGFNGWTSMMAEKARRLVLLQNAARSFQNSAVRKGLNSWLARHREALAKLEAMRKAALGFVHRAVRKGWLKWQPLLLIRQKMRKAALAFMLRHRRRGFSVWTATLAARKATLSRMRGGAAPSRAQPTR